MNYDEEVVLSDQYIALKKDVEFRRKLIEKFGVALRDLLDTCTHEEIKTKTSYFEGGYLDRASTTYTTSCALCGKQIHEKVVTHDYFG